jgi:hypothetical protein
MDFFKLIKNLPKYKREFKLTFQNTTKIPSFVLIKNDEINKYINYIFAFMLL